MGNARSVTLQLLVKLSGEKRNDRKARSHRKLSHRIPPRHLSPHLHQSPVPHHLLRHPPSLSTPPLYPDPSFLRRNPLTSALPSPNRPELCNPFLLLFLLMHLRLRLLLHYIRPCPHGPHLLPSRLSSDIQGLGLTPLPNTGRIVLHGSVPRGIGLLWFVIPRIVPPPSYHTRHPANLPAPQPLLTHS